MPIVPYLSMSPGEMRRNAIFPPKTAWLGCQFSSWNPGLTNLPDALPPDSVLILTDQTPFDGHDARRILHQLEGCIETFSCCALLLDFQRPGNEDAAELAELLAASLPCPVVVSACYGRNLNYPVFLPPVPPSVPLQEWISPWTGREIWLELALDGEEITLTEQGTDTTPLPFGCRGEGFSDEVLHCHYRIEMEKTTVRFTLWRTPEDLEDLILEADRQGVSAAIGLYQELGGIAFS